MISLTRLNGQRFALNPDLIERVEATPDTVVTLVDGSRHVVVEPLESVVDRVRAFRASVVALAQALVATGGADVPVAAEADGGSPALRLISENGGEL